MKLLQAYALSFLGQPYKWGGDDSIDGFDCSGLVQEILASVGEDPPGDQSAQALFDHFSKPGNHVSQDPQLGALVFFGASPRMVSHVAFCLDSRRMIEAGGGGSSTTDRSRAAQANAFVKIRPIRFGKNFLGIFLPDYSPMVTI